MSDAPALLTFFATALAIELTPGPNMAYLALVGVSRGRRDGLMAVAGVSVGLLLLGALVGVGVGSLVVDNRIIYEFLRWAGAAYLVWLAWAGWREAQRAVGAEVRPGGASTYFRRGLVTNLLNPKAALFFIAVMPGFVMTGRPAAEQTVVLLLIYVAAATVVHGTVVMLSSTLQPLYASPQFRRAAAVVFALALIAVAVWLLLKT